MAQPRRRIDRGPSPPALHGATTAGEKSDRYAQLLAELPPAEEGLLYEALGARGKELRDRSGATLGTIAAVLVDRETARPQWLVVERPSTEPLFVGVPIAGLEVESSHCSTPLPVAGIESAPAIDLAGLPARVERDLCQHYELPPTRGAARPTDRRATSSRAFQDGGQLGWLPGPRSG